MYINANNTLRNRLFLFSTHNVYKMQLVPVHVKYAKHQVLAKNKPESPADASVTPLTRAARQCHYLANALEVRQGTFAIKVELVPPPGECV